ncbi:uncharacterized protein LOC126657433 [Mercurialis annua]|uniref:uncharacterized protein LOC126657433 n=1 Tax=Mercurialis annua TaxID=3986 RepID=UPI0021607439|nr:uncharacterized protein LOC126657433 [Mercurialis annua]
MCWRTENTTTMEPQRMFGFSKRREMTQRPATESGVEQKYGLMFFGLNRLVTVVLHRSKIFYRWISDYGGGGRGGEYFWRKVYRRWRCNTDILLLKFNCISATEI